MCGRLACGISTQEIKELTNINEIRNINEYKQSYNIPPSTKILSIYKNNIKSDLKDEVCDDFYIDLNKWGTEMNSSSNGVINLINIRTESIDYVSQFKTMMNNKNFTLIIVEGYFEWKSEGKNKGKSPFFIKGKSKKVIYLIGLYEYNNGEKRVLILTQKSSMVLEKIHDRMPLFVDLSEGKDWLNMKNSNEAMKFIKEITKRNLNMSEEYFDYYEIGDYVSDLKRTGKEVIKKKNEIIYNKNNNYTMKGFFYMKLKKKTDDEEQSIDIQSISNDDRKIDFAGFDWVEAVKNSNFKLKKEGDDEKKVVLPKKVKNKKEKKENEKQSLLNYFNKVMKNN